ncbi:MAG TPA: VWA domain-containing protein [Acidimicrobiales bacterium]|nr:VWA domain-containing protein [Acidimicrobiales bacterium]
MTVRVRNILRVALATLWLGAATVALAPSAAAGQDQIRVDKVDTTSYPNVELTVTAPSSLLGITVPTTSWRLLEAGTGRALVTKPLEQEAISVILVMDTSGSMAGQPLIQAKSAAIDFLERLPQGTSAAIVGFGDTPDVKTPFTSNRDELAVAIDELNASGETALYDAIETSVALLDEAPGDRTGIVLLTDGGDTVSTTDLPTATLALTEAETNFTAIALQTGESDREALQFFAAGTGGQVLGADDPGSLAGVYVGIADQLANQYQLSYESVTDEIETDIDVFIDFEGIEASARTPVILPPLAARPAPETPVDAEAEAEAAGPVVAVAGEPGLFSRSWAFWAGALLIAAALAIGGAILFAPRLKMRSLKTDEAVRDAEDFDILHDVTEKAGSFSAKVLERTGAFPGLDSTLEQAGVEVRPGELVAMVAAASLFGGAIATLLSGPIFGLVIAVIPIIATPIVLNILRTRRQTRFADQLADTLLLFSSTLRAGYGLPQAIDTVANESPEPTATEFGRVVLEARLGRPADESLERLGIRMNNEDFGWVVDAVRIQRDVGGNLAEVLDHIEETIRARSRIRRQVRALTAEGRLSAIVLLSLPFGIGLIIWISNPDYIKPLFTDTIGRIMLGVGLLLILVGSLWLKKLVEPEF